MSAASAAVSGLANVRGAVYLLASRWLGRVRLREWLVWIHRGKRTVHFPRVPNGVTPAEYVGTLVQQNILPRGAAVGACITMVTVGRIRVATLDATCEAPSTRRQKAFGWALATELTGTPLMRIPASWWDMPVDGTAVAIAQYLRLDSGRGSPVCLYHGTTAASARAILAQGFVLPRPHETPLHREVRRADATREDGTPHGSVSHKARTASTRPHGMLGNGVYLTTYDKALRFATHTAAKHVREETERGAVLRCIVRDTTGAMVLHQALQCPCCGGAGVDHTGSWSRQAPLCIVHGNTHNTHGVEVVVADPRGVIPVQSRLAPKHVQPDTPAWTPGGQGGGGTPLYDASAPDSPAYCAGGCTPEAAATSPPFCPTSPPFCPTSPAFCPTSPPLCPTSPPLCPTSPSALPTGGALVGL